MAGQQVKVGDEVAWDKVPSGSVVRWRWDGHGNEFHWKRHNFVASLVGTHTGEWRSPGGDDGSFAPGELVTIIALDVPADATTDDLRALAERFEVREALSQALKTSSDEYATCADEVFDMVGIVLLLSGLTVGALAERLQGGNTTVPDGVAERLHATGWRPGMTAEDAERLLAGSRDA